MSESQERYYVFAEDKQTYGPADEGLIRDWAKNGSLSSESWVYAEKGDVWSRAKNLTSLKGCLATGAPPMESAPVETGAGITGGQLRRIRLFADMSDEQALQFVGLLEKVKARAFAPIVSQGEHGDSMYLILDGEARVSIRSGEKEDTIAILGVGDFFGEIALMDAGPRSADVSANRDCILLKLSKTHFETLVSEYPDLASRFLMAMNRYLGARIRSTNERFTNAQNFARGVSGKVTAPANVKWVRPGSP